MKTMLFMAGVLSCASIAYAADQPIVTGEHAIIVSSDLLAFIKQLFVAGGIFLGLYATIGICFFGFDMAKSRASLGDSIKEARLILIDAKKEIDEKLQRIKDIAIEAEEKINRVNDKIKELSELTSYVEQTRDRMEQIGAQLEEETSTTGESAAISKSESGVGEEHKTMGEVPGLVAEKVQFNGEENVARSDLSLIKDIINRSKYTWTSMKLIMNKTGLARDDILRLARSDPNIDIGIGKDSKDHIFRLK